ncbi:hypothetical protein [Devosia nitrariae]|uniref:Uncharacterized protein n=1 Tax=Devosia nitrariae TaxID=2071872 RepID=A0ABQ5WAW3_9HYPH|nr:hypothetical protein [Devosia nitrariae]GLQ57260.1 hypothetical protein GCM10010862_45190 [Devosia nitrariae]
MNIPAWTKPALYGAVSGAVLLAIVGFMWGGWVTAGSAQDLATKKSAADVVVALTPYCVERSRTDPARVTVLAELEAARSTAKRAVIEKAGWATPLGSESPNRALATACITALEAA